jgi:hypothetical protein
MMAANQATRENVRNAPIVIGNKLKANAIFANSLFDSRETKYRTAAKPIIRKAARTFGCGIVP